jgi:tetratricopeptide (TPR) repeat protein
MGPVRHGSRGARRALLVLILVCSGGSALAQQGPDAAETRRKASEHVQRGDAFKESGDYRAAAREYERAYALVPHPVLFFNLAQVFRLDGDRERAIEFYERYLAAEPNGRASRQARQFAAQLRREIEIAGGARDDARPPAAARPARAGPGRTPQRAGKRAAVASRPAPGRGLRVAGMIAAGAGLVAIGVGIKFGLDARAASDDINGHLSGQWTDELLARQEDGERAERNMFILTATGAAAVAAGGALYYLGHRARRAGAERPVAVGPLAPGHGLGLVVFGRF